MSHYVNVLNADKLKLYIRVEILVLVSFTSGFVGHGVNLSMIKELEYKSKLLEHDKSYEGIQLY